MQNKISIYIFIHVAQIFVVNDNFARVHTIHNLAGRLKETCGMRKRWQVAATACLRYWYTVTT